MTKRTKIETVRALANAIIRDTNNLTQATCLAHHYDRRAGYELARSNARRSAEAFKLVRS